MAFFTIVYIETRNLVQEQALQRYFLGSFVVGIPTNFAIGVVFFGNLEFAAIRREEHRPLPSCQPVLCVPQPPTVDPLRLLF